MEEGRDMSYRGLGKGFVFTLRHKAIKEWCELTVVFKIATLAAMDEPACKRGMLNSKQELTTVTRAKTRVNEDTYGFTYLLTRSQACC